MRRWRARRVWLVVGVVLAAPTAAHAWGGAGHEIVAGIAEDRLGPDARALVREVAGTTPLADPDLCLWPDTHRDERTRRWHVVNLPYGAAYDRGRDCPRDDCAVEQLERAAEVLVRSDDPEARLLALRWLVHLAGDVHQPLHAGERWQRGGSGLRVWSSADASATNLHRVWDVDVVKPVLAGRTPAETARRLGGAIDADDAERWSKELRARTWAEESSATARRIYEELGVSNAPHDGVHLRPGYAVEQRARVEAALRRAGVRLAALLDAVASARSRRAIPPR